MSDRVQHRLTIWVDTPMVDDHGSMWSTVRVLEDVTTALDAARVEAVVKYEGFDQVSATRRAR